ncbi:MAG: hypothetical protein WAL84_02285 [Candidatus Dormiibacterota bacterium]
MIDKYALCVDRAYRLQKGGLRPRSSPTSPLYASDEARDAVLDILGILDVAAPRRTAQRGRWAGQDVVEDEPEDTEVSA